MATEIIADGTSAATSAASTLADGAAVTFSMRGRGYGVVQIQTTTGWEDMADKQIGIGTPVQVFGPGSFRVRRPAQTNSCAFETA
jgi:hypothetical protein